MNESILRALMRLFAMVASAREHDLTQQSRNVVERYLRQKLNRESAEEFIALFDEHVNKQTRSSKVTDEKRRKSFSLNSVKVLGICAEINDQLEQREKIIVLIRLMEFASSEGPLSPFETDFIKGVSDSFNISKNEFRVLKNFVLDENQEVEEQPDILEISRDNPSNLNLFIERQNLNGVTRILAIKSTNTFILKHQGTDELSLNSQQVIEGQSYVFGYGEILKGKRINPVYYTDISRKFLGAINSDRILLTVENVEFRFPKSDTGIHNLSFVAESGQLMGIMGGSGVGKSTLLNVLNGTLPINSGKIRINGLGLHTDKERIKGVIGYVPQDDLLIDELTVFQNLYYNAKLCFSDWDENQILDTVNRVLDDLELTQIKGLTVGDPLNKFISGGQRKRLNIGLELIREPSILIVDEPTSGLSSQDSDMVMSLLKEQTIKGKLAIINIHQPSSEIYKLFDKLLIMDRGGYPVYQGNPVDAITYFKNAAQQLNANESECEACGNVNPEQILQILESKVVNEFGKFTKTRKTTPQEWNGIYMESLNKDIRIPAIQEQIALPKNEFSPPGLFNQFKIFGTRNLLSKLTNKQYLLINFLEAPALAFILSFFTKYFSGTGVDSGAYVFSNNGNIPAYMFMAIIVALFIGLTVSAEEIIKDSRILKREEFLNLSWFSYINSKIAVLLTLAAFQSLSFVLVGNFILEIQGMNLSYFLVLFSTMASAILVGLNISSALNSAVTIYITIPFILVPQLLFGGVLVNFSKVHKSFASVETVPVIGELMFSRWAYEALAVTQFKCNAFEKHFFEIDKAISEASFQTVFRIPELETRIDKCLVTVKTGSKDDQFQANLALISNELGKMSSLANCAKSGKNLNPEGFKAEKAQDIQGCLKLISKHYSKAEKQARKKRETQISLLSEQLEENETLSSLKSKHHNIRLEDLVLNRTEKKQLVVTEKRTLVQLNDPVFRNPHSNLGRAHFYSPVKKLFGLTIDTLWFNIGILWVSIGILYIMLRFKLLKRALSAIG